MLLPSPVIMGLAVTSYRVRENQNSVDALRREIGGNSSDLLSALDKSAQIALVTRETISRESELLRKQLLEMHLALTSNQDVACPYCNQLISEKALICNQCQGILNIGPWDFIRVALLFRPELIMRDRETISELKEVVKNIEEEVHRIVELEKAREIELRLIEVEENRKKAEARALEISARETARQSEIEASQRAERAALETKNRLITSANKDLGIISQLHQRVITDVDALNVKTIYEEFRNSISLTKEEYKAALHNTQFSQISKYIYEIGDNLMTKNKLTIEESKFANQVLAIALDFGVELARASICRSLYLSKQFQKCIEYVDNNLKFTLSNPDIHDGLLLDRLKSIAILGRLDISIVETTLLKLKNREEFQSKLVIGAAFLLCGDTKKSLEIRDSISEVHLQEASWLYEPDFDSDHPEIANFDHIVMAVIEG